SVDGSAARTMLRPAPSADRRGAGRAWRGMREARGRRQDRAMTEHDVRPSPAPAAHAPAALRPAAQPYHRASRTLAHRRYWWRPLVTLAVSAAVFVGLTMQVMVPLFVLGEVWPAAVTSSSLTDPLSPAVQFLGRGLPAAVAVVPVYLLVNAVVNLVLEREAIVVPPLGAGVLLAWLLALVLSPLQCAGEEFVFRALPMQMLGTWLRRPVLGILLPVPLFM